ncbi:hypothetical protein BU26DRAFT_513639 [Trematosphaeria pertusa]|uniref:DUF4185 domain-containing protein n=1 Tax=Trematosphaeria pertusa TaxID=390896 RepID=A0A6A6J3F9_9PLEO|nr:uncharacterized protein BU26DRAFT_513639 [Trematosphaeria pertusa]KAF2256887.1 hypothetical protein BU26DRAFT_513639 [Trematosphaeria pertusa]
MEKLKTAFANITTKLQLQQQPQQSQNDHPISPNTNSSTPSTGRLSWPPKLASPPRVLGEVKDTSGRPYPRDFGRSIRLGGHTYYMFGDTFCFDSSGAFCGVTNNSIALIPSLHNPTKSQWLTPDAKVPEFVPYSDEEREFCRRHAAKGENKRFVNWAFGGAVERPGSAGREAWLFYDTCEVHGAEAVRHCGVGVAKARVTDVQSGQIECGRVGAFPLFDPEGPAWGNISNIAAPDGWTYLLTGRELDNYMARIRTDADFSNPANYQFLKKGGHWVSSYHAPYGPFGELAHDVLHGQGQGAIVYLPEHGPRGRPYVWFGCEKFMTSKLWVGAAARPEGPWELHSVGEMPKINGAQSKTRYCIYPHLWGSKPGRGEMLISWSDDGTMGGKVAVGVFTFAVV